MSSEDRQEASPIRNLALAVETDRQQLRAHLKEAGWPHDVQFYAEELALALARNTPLAPGEVRPHVRRWLTEFRCELLAWGVARET